MEHGVVEGNHSVLQITFSFSSSPIQNIGPAEVLWFTVEVDIR